MQPPVVIVGSFCGRVDKPVRSKAAILLQRGIVSANELMSRPGLLRQAPAGCAGLENCSTSENISTRGGDQVNRPVNPDSGICSTLH
jgi:hypothetical protein